VLVPVVDTPEVELGEPCVAAVDGPPVVVLACPPLPPVASPSSLQAIRRAVAIQNKGRSIAES
jgi:hypothetical protein